MPQRLSRTRTFCSRGPAQPGAVAEDVVGPIEHVPIRPFAAATFSVWALTKKTVRVPAVVVGQHIGQQHQRPRPRDVGDRHSEDREQTVIGRSAQGVRAASVRGRAGVTSGRSWARRSECVASQRKCETTLTPSPSPTVRRPRRLSVMVDGERPPHSGERGVARLSTSEIHNPKSEISIRAAAAEHAQGRTQQ